MISILLADDHAVVREALRLLLETQPDFKVLAEAGDGPEAVRLAEQFKPDVLIADMSMPLLSGLEVTRLVRHIAPQTRIIVLSMYEAESYVAEALGVGAAGYVLKKDSAQELIFAIRQALAGNQYLSPALNQRMLAAYQQRSTESRAEDPLETLTHREREVFQLAAEGLNNPQIAEKLFLSARTVEKHRANLMKKLGLKSQTDLVKYAIRRGQASS